MDDQEFAALLAELQAMGEPGTPNPGQTMPVPGVYATPPQGAVPGVDMGQFTAQFAQSGLPRDIQGSQEQRVQPYRDPRVQSSTTPFGDVVAGAVGTEYGPLASGIDRNLQAARPFAREMTGIPMFGRGVDDVGSGIYEGNPAQTLRGAGQIALAALPYTRAGRAVAGAHPFLTAGGAIAIPNIDASTPAQAASKAHLMPPVQMPPPDQIPLPEGRPDRGQVGPQGVQAAPQQPPAGQPPAEEPGYLNRAWDQIVNNAGQAADYVGGLASDVTKAAGDVAGSLGLGGKSNTFVPPKFNDWVETQGSPTATAFKTAQENLKKETDDGGFGPKAIRAQAVVDRLSAKLQQEYADDVDRLRTEHKHWLDQPAAKRYPIAYNAALLAPTVLAGGKYRRALNKHNASINDAAGIPQKGWFGRTKPSQFADPPTAAQRDEIAALTADQPPGGVFSMPGLRNLPRAQKVGNEPSVGPYAKGAVASTIAMKGMIDLIDGTTLPDDSKARLKAQLGYIPFNPETGQWDFSEFTKRMAELAARGTIAHTGVQSARLGTRQPSQLALERAKTRAAIPNATATRARLEAGDEVARLKRQSEINRANLPDVPPKPPVSPPTTNSTPRKSQGTGQTGPGRGGSEQSQEPQTAGNPAQNQNTVNPGQGQGTGQSRKPKSETLTKPFREKVGERFADNGGKFTQKDIDELIPNVSERSRKQYIEKLNKAWSSLTPQQFRQGLKDGWLLTALGVTAGTGAAGGLASPEE